MAAKPGKPKDEKVDSLWASANHVTPKPHSARCSGVVGLPDAHAYKC